MRLMNRLAGLAAQDRASHRSAPISILIRRKLQYGFLAAIAALTLGAVSLASPVTAAVSWSSALPLPGVRRCDWTGRCGVARHLTYPAATPA
jgi:hypothetical protein